MFLKTCVSCGCKFTAYNNSDSGLCPACCGNDVNEEVNGVLSRQPSFKERCGGERSLWDSCAIEM